MNAKPPTWQIQLHGTGADLAHLAKFFAAGEFRVFADGQGGYLYESNAFDQCADSHAVVATANAALAMLSGVLKVARDSQSPLTAGSVFRTNVAGGRDVFVHPKPIAMRFEVGDLTFKLSDALGNDITPPRPPPRTVKLMQIAATDVAVAKVMRLVTASDAGSWGGLYRIHEVIAGDVGDLITKGWSSPKQLDRFKHTANSGAAAGDGARHGHDKHKPPKNPMALAEADAYVKKILQSWLALKGA